MFLIQGYKAGRWGRELGTEFEGKSRGPAVLDTHRK